MDEGEVLKCPKCGEETEEANELRGISAIRFYRKGESFVWRTSKAYSFILKNCGYIELYKEMKKKKEQT